MSKATTKKEESTITFTDWEKKQLLDLLNNQNLSKAPLGVMADALEVRNKFKQEGNEFDFTEQQFNLVAEIALNPNIRWPVSEDSLELAKKLQK